MNALEVVGYGLMCLPLIAGALWLAWERLWFELAAGVVIVGFFVGTTLALIGGDR